MARKHLPFRPVLDALEGRVVLSKVTPTPTPSTWTVMNNLDSGAGSLRAEVAAANPGDIIVFAPGLDGQTIALTGGELLVNKSLIIQGPGAGLLAVSGGNASRVFEVAAGVQATLAGLTIEGGNGEPTPNYADGRGGAILNWGTLTVGSSTVSGSSASFGGGLYNAGTLTVSSSTVSGNSAGFYGGGGIYNTATLTVSNSTVSGNTAYRGGGIENADIAGKLASASISGSTLSGNTGTGGYPVGGVAWGGSSQAWYEGGGGGLWNDGIMTVSGSTLSANVAGGPLGGGGLYNAGTLTVSSSTISGNSATSYGGGIYNDEGANLTLNKTTVTQNTAVFGGGIYNDQDAFVTLEQATVTQNTAPGSNLNQVNIYNDSGGVIISKKG